MVLRPARTPSTHMIPVQILLKENGSFLGNMLRENKTRFLNKLYLIKFQHKIVLWGLPLKKILILKVLKTKAHYYKMLIWHKFTLGFKDTD